jgi:hypothetical protein
MALVVIPCANIIKLKRFIEAVSFSSASTFLLPQLSFEHAQVDVDENSYLLISGSIPEKFLSAVQNQIIMTVQSLESSLMSSFMLGGTVIDDFSSGEKLHQTAYTPCLLFSTILSLLHVLPKPIYRYQITYIVRHGCIVAIETGRMCLIKCAEESLKIFLIEVHGDNALNLNNNSSRQQRFQIFTEWACRGSFNQRYNDLNKNSDTVRNRRITFDTSGTSTDSEFSAGDVGGGRETTKSTLIRALNAVQNSQIAPYTYSRDAKSKITALSSESSYRKILLASKQSNAVTAAADRALHSPTRSPNSQASITFDSDVHSDCPKRSRKNSEGENERSSQHYRADIDMSESDRAIDQDRDKEREKENEKDNSNKGWNAENIGARIPSLELSLLHNGAYRHMTANSPKPIPFENEFFAGHLLLLVNTKPICAQYFKRFEGGKNEHSSLLYDKLSEMYL